MTWALVCLPIGILLLLLSAGLKPVLLGLAQLIAALGFLLSLTFVGLLWGLDWALGAFFVCGISLNIVKALCREFQASRAEKQRQIWKAKQTQLSAVRAQRSREYHPPAY